MSETMTPTLTVSVFSDTQFEPCEFWVCKPARAAATLPRVFSKVFRNSRLVRSNCAKPFLHALAAILWRQSLCLEVIA